jgi:hypothetical protein
MSPPGSPQVKVDDRTNYNPGHKFNHWELRGVPLRFELGMMDLEKGVVSVARRVDAIKDPKKRTAIPFGEALAQTTTDMLEEIQVKPPFLLPLFLETQVSAKAGGEGEGGDDTGGARVLGLTPLAMLIGAPTAGSDVCASDGGSGRQVVAGD